MIFRVFFSSSGILASSLNSAISTNKKGVRSLDTQGIVPLGEFCLLSIVSVGIPSNVLHTITPSITRSGSVVVIMVRRSSVAISLPGYSGLARQDSKMPCIRANCG